MNVPLLHFVDSCQCDFYRLARQKKKERELKPKVVKWSQY